MSATSNTRSFFSAKFLCTVRAYRGYVIVPVDSTGSRGGNKRTFEIWSGAQGTRYNRNIASLGAAKALIDSGRVVTIHALGADQGAKDGAE